MAPINKIATVLILMFVVGMGTVKLLGYPEAVYKPYGVVCVNELTGQVKIWATKEAKQKLEITSDSVVGYENETVLFSYKRTFGETCQRATLEEIEAFVNSRQVVAPAREDKRAL